MSEPRFNSDTRQEPEERRQRESAVYDGVGAELKAYRLASGQTLEDVSARLRIRLAHLRALEEGDFASLPGRIYAIGFLRSYADFLGFDGHEAVERFKREHAGKEQPSRLVFPTPTPESRMPKGWLIAASLLVAAGLYGGWIYVQEPGGGPIDAVPPVPAHLALSDEGAVEIPEPTASAEATGSEVAPPARTEPDSTVADREPVPDPSPVPAAEELPEPPSTVAEVPAGASPPAVSEEPTPAPAAEAELLPTPSAPESAPGGEEQASVDHRSAMAAARPPELPAAFDPGGQGAGEQGYVPQIFGVGNTDARVEVVAVMDSWVQVRGPENELLLTRVLKAGDRYRVPNRDGVVMATGNVGGLEIRVDGRALPPFGDVGNVRRGIPLDADLLLSELAITPDGSIE